MNKNVIRDKLEHGQIIVDYISNHLLLAWNELTLLNQAIDQNKKILNLTLNYVDIVNLYSYNSIQKEIKKKSQKFIFVFPNVTESEVFIDQSFLQWIDNFLKKGDFVYIISPTINKQFAEELVKILDRIGVKFQYLDFLFEHQEKNNPDILQYVSSNIYNMSEVFYEAINSVTDLRSTQFYIAQSTLINQNFHFKIFPMETEKDVEKTRLNTQINEVSEKTKIKINHYPNELVANHSAIIYAIVLKWKIFLFDYQKNLQLKKIIEWQNTLDKQVIENKKLQVRYRGILIDEDIQELSILNGDDR